MGAGNSVIQETPGTNYVPKSFDGGFSKFMAKPLPPKNAFATKFEEFIQEDILLLSGQKNYDRNEDEDEEEEEEHVTQSGYFSDRLVMDEKLTGVPQNDPEVDKQQAKIAAGFIEAMNKRQVSEGVTVELKNFFYVYAGEISSALNNLPKGLPNSVLNSHLKSIFEGLKDVLGIFEKLGIKPDYSATEDTKTIRDMRDEILSRIKIIDAIEQKTRDGDINDVRYKNIKTDLAKYCAYGRVISQSLVTKVFMISNNYKSKFKAFEDFLLAVQCIVVSRTEFSYKCLAITYLIDFLSCQGIDIRSENLSQHHPQKTFDFFSNNKDTVMDESFFVSGLEDDNELQRLKELRIEQDKIRGQIDQNNTSVGIVSGYLKEYKETLGELNILIENAVKSGNTKEKTKLEGDKRVVKRNIVKNITEAKELNAKAEYLKQQRSDIESEIRSLESKEQQQQQQQKKQQPQQKQKQKQIDIMEEDEDEEKKQRPKYTQKFGEHTKSFTLSDTILIPKPEVVSDANGCVNSLVDVMGDSMFSMMAGYGTAKEDGDDTSPNDLFGVEHGSKGPEFKIKHEDNKKFDSYSKSFFNFGKFYADTYQKILWFCKTIDLEIDHKKLDDKVYGKKNAKLPGLNNLLGSFDPMKSYSSFTENALSRYIERTKQAYGLNNESEKIVQGFLTSPGEYDGDQIPDSLNRSKSMLGSMFSEILTPVLNGVYGVSLSVYENASPNIIFRTTPPPSEASSSSAEEFVSVNKYPQTEESRQDEKNKNKWKFVDKSGSFMVTALSNTGTNAYPYMVVCGDSKDKKLYSTNASSLDSLLEHVFGVTIQGIKQYVRSFGVDELEIYKDQVSDEDVAGGSGILGYIKPFFSRILTTIARPSYSAAASKGIFGKVVGAPFDFLEFAKSCFKQSTKSPSPKDVQSTISQEQRDRGKIFMKRMQEEKDGKLTDKQYDEYIGNIFSATTTNPPGSDDKWKSSIKDFSGYTPQERAEMEQMEKDYEKNSGYVYTLLCMVMRRIDKVGDWLESVARDKHWANSTGFFNSIINAFCGWILRYLCLGPLTVSLNFLKDIVKISLSVMIYKRVRYGTPPVETLIWTNAGFFMNFKNLFWYLSAGGKPSQIYKKLDGLSEKEIDEEMFRATKLNNSSLVYSLVMLFGNSIIVSFSGMALIPYGFVVFGLWRIFDGWFCRTFFGISAMTAILRVLTPYMSTRTKIMLTRFMNGAHVVSNIIDALNRFMVVFNFFGGLYKSLAAGASLTHLITNSTAYQNAQKAMTYVKTLWAGNFAALGVATIKHKYIEKKVINDNGKYISIKCVDVKQYNDDKLDKYRGLLAAMNFTMNTFSAFGAIHIIAGKVIRWIKRFFNLFLLPGYTPTKANDNILVKGYKLFARGIIKVFGNWGVRIVTGLFEYGLRYLIGSELTKTIMISNGMCKFGSAYMYGKIVESIDDSSLVGLALGVTSVFALKFFPDPVFMIDEKTNQLLKDETGKPIRILDYQKMQILDSEGNFDQSPMYQKLFFWSGEEAKDAVKNAFNSALGDAKGYARAALDSIPGARTVFNGLRTGATGVYELGAGIFDMTSSGVQTVGEGLSGFFQSSRGFTGDQADKVSKILHADYKGMEFEKNNPNPEFEKMDREWVDRIKRNIEETSPAGVSADLFAAFHSPSHIRITAEYIHIKKTHEGENHILYTQKSTKFDRDPFAPDKVKFQYDQGAGGPDAKTGRGRAANWYNEDEMDENDWEDLKKQQESDNQDGTEFDDYGNPVWNDSPYRINMDQEQVKVEKFENEFKDELHKSGQKDEEITKAAQDGLEKEITRTLDEHTKTFQKKTFISQDDFTLQKTSNDVFRRFELNAETQKFVDPQSNSGWLDSIKGYAGYVLTGNPGSSNNNKSIFNEKTPEQILEQEMQDRLNQRGNEQIDQALLDEQLRKQNYIQQQLERANTKRPIPEDDDMEGDFEDASNFVAAPEDDNPRSIANPPWYDPQDPEFVIDEEDFSIVYFPISMHDKDKTYWYRYEGFPYTWIWSQVPAIIASHSAIKTGVCMMGENGELDQCVHDYRSEDNNNTQTFFVSASEETTTTPQPKKTKTFVMKPAAATPTPTLRPKKQNTQQEMQKNVEACISNLIGKCVSKNDSKKILTKSAVAAKETIIMMRSAGPDSFIDINDNYLAYPMFSGTEPGGFMKHVWNDLRAETEKVLLSGNSNQMITSEPMALCGDLIKASVTVLCIPKRKIGENRGWAICILSSVDPNKDCAVSNYMPVSSGVASTILSSLSQTDSGILRQEMESENNTRQQYQQQTDSYKITQMFMNDASRLVDGEGNIVNNFNIDDIFQKDKSKWNETMRLMGLNPQGNPTPNKNLGMYFVKMNFKSSGEDGVSTAVSANTFKLLIRVTEAPHTLDVSDKQKQMEFHDLTPILEVVQETIVSDIDGKPMYDEKTHKYILPRSIKQKYETLSHQRAISDPRVIDSFQGVARFDTIAKNCDEYPAVILDEFLACKTKAKMLVTDTTEYRGCSPGELVIPDNEVVYDGGISFASSTKTKSFVYDPVRAGSDSPSSVLQKKQFTIYAESVLGRIRSESLRNEAAAHFSSLEDQDSLAKILMSISNDDNMIITLKGVLALKTSAKVVDSVSSSFKNSSGRGIDAIGNTIITAQSSISTSKKRRGIDDDDETYDLRKPTVVELLEKSKEIEDQRIMEYRGITTDTTTTKQTEKREHKRRNANQSTYSSILFTRFFLSSRITGSLKIYPDIETTFNRLKGNVDFNLLSELAISIPLRFLDTTKDGNLKSQSYLSRGIITNSKITFSRLSELIATYISKVGEIKPKYIPLLEYVIGDMEFYLRSTRAKICNEITSAKIQHLLGGVDKHLSNLLMKNDSSGGFLKSYSSNVARTREKIKSLISVQELFEKIEVLTPETQHGVVDDYKFGGNTEDVFEDYERMFNQGGEFTKKRSLENSYRLFTDQASGVWTLNLNQNNSEEESSRSLVLIEPYTPKMFSHHINNSVLIHGKFGITSLKEISSRSGFYYIAMVLMSMFPEYSDFIKSDDFVYYFSKSTTEADVCAYSSIKNDSRYLVGLIFKELALLCSCGVTKVSVDENVNMSEFSKKYPGMATPFDFNKINGYYLAYSIGTCLEALCKDGKQLRDPKDIITYVGNRMWMYARYCSCSSSPVPCPANTVHVCRISPVPVSLEREESKLVSLRSRPCELHSTNPREISPLITGGFTCIHAPAYMQVFGVVSDDGENTTKESTKKHIIPYISIPMTSSVSVKDVGAIPKYSYKFDKNGASSSETANYILNGYKKTSFFKGDGTKAFVDGFDPDTSEVWSYELSRQGSSSKRFFSANLTQYMTSNGISEHELLWRYAYNVIFGDKNSIENTVIFGRNQPGTNYADLPFKAHSIRDMYCSSPRVVGEGIFPYIIQYPESNFVDAFIQLQMSTLKFSSSDKSKEIIKSSYSEANKEFGSGSTVTTSTQIRFLEYLNSEKRAIEALEKSKPFDDLEMFFILEKCLFRQTKISNESPTLFAFQRGYYACNKKHALANENGVIQSGLFIEMFGDNGNVDSIAKFLENSSLQITDRSKPYMREIVSEDIQTGPICVYCDSENTEDSHFKPLFFDLGFSKIDSIIPLWFGSSRGMAFDSQFIKRFVIISTSTDNDITSKFVRSKLSSPNPSDKPKLFLMMSFMIYSPVFNEYIVFTIDLAKKSWVCHRRNISAFIRFEDIKEFTSLYRIENSIVTGMVFAKT